jgi:tetratricopeptide (TPR) repeat protein
MRSNSQRLRQTLLVLGIVAVSILGVGSTRARLFATHEKARRQADVYFLPAPELTPLASLGYRAALADLIFAHVLVAYGQHFQEKRRFEFVAHYLDAITTLDPRFREPYRLADTLITLQPKAPRLEDYRAARRLQERGLAAFPLDSELWLIAGQFAAYLAANHVPEAERDEYRLSGAKKLARSCELVSSNENIPHHCITAAVLYNDAGRVEAAQRFLERVLNVSDDPEIQQIAGGYLQRIVGEGQRARLEERLRRFHALWSRDLTFVSRDLLLLLGPGFDSGRCAGVEGRRAPECATSFRAWGEQQESTESGGSL